MTAFNKRFHDQEHGVRMAVVKRALLLSTGERYWALMTNFVTVAVVSRILTPEEVGISVIGMAIVGIALSAREFGSTNFFIQRRNLDRKELRGAFTVVMLVTLVLASTLAAAAPLLADAYGEPRLVPYLRVISAGILLELVAAPTLTLLRRDMAFGRVAIINMSGAAVACGVTLCLVALGFSYMSFAWAWLAAAVTTGVLALCLNPHIWIFQPSVGAWRGMLTFGGYNGGTNLLYKAYEALPYLLLGRFLSLDSAAMYSRSLMICQLPDRVILGGAIAVVLPAFSAEARQGRSLKEPYLNAVALVTALQWPALLVLACLAHPVVDLLLGHQWHGVAPLVQIVAIASLFSFSFELNYPILVSLGAVHDVFRRAVIVYPVSAVVIALASFLGLYGVAFSLLLVTPFQAYVSMSFLRRHIEISWAEVGSAVWRSAAAAAAAVAGPLAVIIAIGSGFELSIVEALVAAGLGALGWAAGLWLTGHLLLAEILQTLAGFRFGAGAGQRALELRSSD
jgi:O-antigen/teichoic acid export membrane protein